MGYIEAKEDGIRVQKKGYRKFYYPKCHMCGTEVASPFYNRDSKYTCHMCKMLIDTETKAVVSTEKKEDKFRNAIFRISQVTDIQKYESAIDKIHKVLHRDGWFQSTEEIMVGIELIKNGYKINHQVPIKRYKLDFVLRDIKLIIEVDGIFHNQKTKAKEQLRDDIAIASFGAEWEVLRISTDDINNNITRLNEAILKVVERRRRYRAGLSGQLPDWYNDREKYSDKKRPEREVKLRVLK